MLRILCTHINASITVIACLADETPGLHLAQSGCARQSKWAEGASKLNQLCVGIAAWHVWELALDPVIPMQSKLKMRGEMLREMLDLESHVQDTRAFKLCVCAIVRVWCHLIICISQMSNKKLVDFSSFWMLYIYSSSRHVHCCLFLGFDVLYS